MNLILVSDKCIHKQTRKQLTWLDALQKLYQSQFLQTKPKLYCTAAESLANCATLLYLSFILSYAMPFHL